MAGPPSPLKPGSPVPANVLMVPGTNVPVGEGVAVAVDGNDGVRVAVALTGLGEACRVPVAASDPAALLDSEPLALADGELVSLSVPNALREPEGVPVALPVGVLDWIDGVLLAVAEANALGELEADRLLRPRSMYP